MRDDLSTEFTTDFHIAVQPEETGEKELKIQSVPRLLYPEPEENGQS